MVVESEHLTYLPCFR